MTAVVHVLVPLFVFFPPIPFIVFVLLLQLPLYLVITGICNAAVVRNSDPGPQSRLFSPVPTDMLYHVRCVPCVFIARRVEHFLPSSTGIELCLHTLSTESSPPLPETLSSMRVKVQQKTLLFKNIIAVYH